MMNASSLYLLSPPVIGGDFFYSLENVLKTGVVGLFQLRLKGVDDAYYSDAARRAVQCCKAYGVLCYMNDRADIAYEAGADGVHIGEDDATITDIIRAYPSLAVGVSCYNDITRAISVADAGAAYVSFGAFFPTTTKQPKTRADVSLLREWKRIRRDVPVCAIGGITADNVRMLADAGADYMAVVGAIWNHPCPENYAAMLVKHMTG